MVFDLVNGTANNAGKIAIIGYGVVGQAVHYGIKDECAGKVIIIDPAIGLQYEDIEGEMRNVEAFFICVPTPTKENSGVDTRELSAAVLNGLLKFPSAIPIIKSTFMPNMFKHKGIVYNPEFLNQRSANSDFICQETVILGGMYCHTRKAEAIYRKYFIGGDDKNYEHCSLTDASFVKYLHNVYHAYKSLFWNYTNEITNGNVRKIFGLYSKITGNKNEMQHIYADGKAGYGGACFPKDVRAVHYKYSHELTDFMIKYNERIRNG